MNCDEGKKCPLCTEEMDWTDQQLKPCQCGYQVCVWCWHHLMDMAEKDETEGRCPACRVPYDKEKIVGMEANCERVVATKKDRKNKTQKSKPKKPEERKDLSNVRVIQRKMAYVIGLPLSLADEDLLRRKEYFGQYGKVSKISLSRTAGGAVQQFVNDSCSVYITYSKEEEAIRCIQSVHGFVLEGRFLRASFGTAKYCHAWLKNMVCTNPACLYLHSIGAEEDSFGKDEEAAVHTRNRVLQIVGATQDMQRRSGNTLPPPLDDSLGNSSIDTEKTVFRSAYNDAALATLTTTGHMSCPFSFSSKDKDGRIKTPNRTFVDIVGRPSSGPGTDDDAFKDRNILDLWSGISSVTIDNDSHVETGCSGSMLFKISSSHLPTGMPGDKDSQEYSVEPNWESSKFSLCGKAGFTPSAACGAMGQSSLISVSERQALPGSCSDVQRDMLLFDNQRLKGSESFDPLRQGSSVLPAYCPVGLLDQSKGHTQHLKENCRVSDYNVEHGTVYNCISDTSIPFTHVNSALIDRYGRKSQSCIESDRKHGSSKASSSEEMVEHLRRLDNANTTNDDSSALDVVESSIISNILSMDFDADDSWTSAHSLAELLDGTDGRCGSWNFRNSNESRFSFAKEENSIEATDLNSSFSNINQLSKNDHSPLDSEEQYVHGTQQHGVRTQSLTPPGFSVPSRDPPPGFSAYQKRNQFVGATSGNHLVEASSLPNNQYIIPSDGNNSNLSDCDRIDAAKLVVGKGRARNSGAGMMPTSTLQPTTYNDKARLWLMNQQEDLENYSPLLMQETQSTCQALGFSDHIGNGFSPMHDTYGISSRHMDQYQTYKPSHFTPLSQQTQGNGHISNGYWLGVDEVQLGNDVGPTATQGNKGLGFNQFFSGYGDVMLQMRSTGDVYNRLYGL